jgi:hypothetical protein
LGFHCCIRQDVFEDKTFDSILELFATTPLVNFTKHYEKARPF